MGHCWSRQAASPPHTARTAHPRAFLAPVFRDATTGDPACRPAEDGVRIRPATDARPASAHPATRLLPSPTWGGGRLANRRSPAGHPGIAAGGRHQGGRRLANRRSGYDGRGGPPHQAGPRSVAARCAGSRPHRGGPAPGRSVARRGRHGHGGERAGGPPPPGHSGSERGENLVERDGAEAGQPVAARSLRQHQRCRRSVTWPAPRGHPGPAPWARRFYRV